MGQEVVDLNSVRQDKKHKKLNRDIDIIASQTVLEECLKMLNVNNLKETKEVKATIESTIKKLRKLIDA
jgi:hypothetical protein